MQDTTTIKFNTTKDRQAHPVDFHVHGSLSASGDGSWAAQGRYINDDGVNLNLNGTVNSYTLLSQYDGKDTITVRVGMDQKATKFESETGSGCYFVNQNDLLGSMHFLNAQALGLANAGSYQVTFSLVCDRTINTQTDYDNINDKLMFTLAGEGQQVCLSRVITIKIQKTA